MESSQSSKAKFSKFQEEEEGGLLWNQLRKFVNLIDELRDLGLQEHINLPRIAVLGTQSSGKSSVLESIVGLDFLPRGDGCVTRRPLELRLHHLQENTAPWALFEEVKGKQFYDFEEVKKTIVDLTDKVCPDMTIKDIPIVLTIHSYTCPDLTLVDLPGITRIPLKGSKMPPNIEQITTDMSKKYCTDERTIILCVIPANIDITTSEALKYSQSWDRQGIRTIGVITKLDIMDKGVNAKNVLLNKEVELKLGYVAVKNRNQEDNQKGIKVQTGLEQEREWFQRHKVYGTLPKENYGTDSLTQKLSRILYAHIRANLPEIVQETELKQREVEERLRDLGNPLPQNESEKMQLLWGLINAFSNSFRNKITGKYDSKAKMPQKGKEKEALTGGAKIKSVFFDLYNDFVVPGYRATASLQDKDITNAIILHEGDNLSGFPSVEVFNYLIEPEIAKLKQPAIECLWNVYDYLEELAKTLVDKTFTRFPAMVGEFMSVVVQLMSEEREKTKYLLESLLNSHLGYMFTNDVEYTGTRTDIIPKIDNQDQFKDATMLYAEEMRLRIETYFKLVVRSVRDSVPKLIGCFLVRSIQDKMQLELPHRLTKNETINTILSEPQFIIEERKRLQQTRDILRKAIKTMQRDPDLNVSYSQTEDELLAELSKLKRENKKKAEEKQEKTKKIASSMFGGEQSQKREGGLSSGARSKQAAPVPSSNIFGAMK